MSIHSLVRDSVFGQLVRLTTNNRFLGFTDSLDCPIEFDTPCESQHGQPVLQRESPSAQKPKWETCVSTISLSSANTALTNDLLDLPPLNWTSRSNDPTNPQNWPTGRKTFVAFQICLYTFTVYLGSSIVLASLPYIIVEYEISETMGSLTIAAYVFGYGLGAMFFSPISEIPSLGRNIPYVTSFALFLVFSVLAATAKSFTGLVVARLFQGLMGSPALATGGASMQDLFELQYVPFAFTGWMGAACLGPALGPTISAFSVQAENWRWSLWEVAWLAGPVFVLMFTLLPETSRAKILFDRRKRLCIPNIGTASQPTMYARFVETLTSTLYRPTKILLTQPAIAFSNVYTCLIYGVYYTFFDSVPRVYLQVYHFEVSEVGLSFLSISAGTVLGIAVFLPWAYRWMRTAETKSPRSDPERCLVPALYASISVPISLLIFAWTSRPSIHWSISLLGVAFYTASIFIVMECLANYLILVYPAHAASLFAGNDFMRATVAAGAVASSHPLYDHLGIAHGVSILAGVTALCTVGMFCMYRYGAVLREKGRCID